MRYFKRHSAYVLNFLRLLICLNEYIDLGTVMNPSPLSRGTLGFPKIYSRGLLVIDQSEVFSACLPILSIHFHHS